jgi:hypothetical protein
MRMDLTKVGKLPTIEQRLARTEKELGYLSAFLVKILAKKLFRNIWVHLYGQELWDANPWVWVAEWEDIEVSR